MYNYLRSNYLSAFTGDREATNNNGGVALWDTPHAIACANNPLVFTRTKYLHMVGNYDPKREGFLRQPNYISIDNTNIRLVFQFKTTSAIYVRFTMDTASGPVTKTQYIPSNTEHFAVSSYGTAITSISAVGFTSDYLYDYIKDDNYIYVHQGYSYTDSDYMCQGTTGYVMYRNDDVDSYSLNVYKSDGTYQRLTAESFHGISKYDVSAVVRQWMYDDLVDMKEDVVADLALYAKYTVRHIGGSGSSYTYLAVNAVAQIGETTDLSAYVGKVLTGFERLSLYEGYDLDYAVLAGASSVTLALGTARAYSVSRVKASDAFALLADKDSNYVGTEAGQYIGLQKRLEIPVISRCVPVNPFYVRWINRLGGVDYWMFSRQQRRVSGVKSATEYAPYVEDTQNARTNRKNYSLATEHTVTVGIVGLEEAVFDELQHLPFSSLVEWFNEKTGRWVTLAVTKYNGQQDTKDALFSFEVTFNLPTINTQY